MGLGDFHIHHRKMCKSPKPIQMIQEWLPAMVVSSNTYSSASFSSCSHGTLDGTSKNLSSRDVRCFTQLTFRSFVLCVSHDEQHIMYTSSNTRQHPHRPHGTTAGETPQSTLYMWHHACMQWSWAPSHQSPLCCVWKTCTHVHWFWRETVFAGNAFERHY